MLLDLTDSAAASLESLSMIKRHPDMKLTPLIVFGDSTSEAEILHSYNLYGNCYIQKPQDQTELTTLMREVVEFWFGLVKLPHR
jgi:DNA-binding NarL/FixJ family response regulator